MAGTSWPSLVAGARAKASEVEAKFDWVEGDFVPMSAGSKADATYDLGESTFRWRDVHFSRQTLGGNGTAAAPTYSFLNSTQMGFYRKGANNLGGSVAGSDWLDVSSAGEILTPLQPYFFAYIDALVTTITTSGQALVLTSTTELIDVNGDYDNTTGLFTAPRTGVYEFLFSFGFVPQTTTVASVAGLYLKTAAAGTFTTAFHSTRSAGDGVSSGATRTNKIYHQFQLQSGDIVAPAFTLSNFTTTVYPTMVGDNPTNLENVSGSLATMTSYNTYFIGRLVG